MKKSLLGFLLILGMVFALGACGGDGNSATSHPKDSNQSSGMINGNSGTSDSGKEEVCEVVFKQDGCADVIRTIEKGKTLSNIPTPKEKTGYTVVWDITDFTNITEDLEVNALITANTYTVTYDANGGNVTTTTQEVTYDTETTLVTPEKEDYYFLGWTYKGNAVVSGEKWAIADNVTLVANWLDHRPTFTVTFVDGNQSKPVTVKKGESVAEADVPAFAGKVGHTVAWDKTDYTNITSNMTVTAIYTPITYTATYSAEGFDVHNKTVRLTYGKICSNLATLSSETQNFLGWTYNGNTYTAESIWNVTEESVVLTASWVAKDQVVVSFVDTNGSTVTKTVYKGQTLTDIPTPSAKKGYTVDAKNWYTDQTYMQVASFENLQENKTFYAKASANIYTVTYDANGGNSVENMSVAFDSAYTLATPTHSLGYMEFVAWKNVDGNAVAMTGKWDTDSGMALIAEWKDTRASYTITFVQAGEQNKTYTVKAGESFAEIPEPIQKKGYTITWDEEAITKLTNINDNVVVIADIVAKTYEITLKANGGELRETKIVVTYGEVYELPIPTREKFVFLKWTYNDSEINSRGTWDIDADNIELVATWLLEEWTGNY